MNSVRAKKPTALIRVLCKVRGEAKRNGITTQFSGEIFTSRPHACLTKFLPLTRLTVQS